MTDGLVFFYAKDGILYPTAMDEKDFVMSRYLVNQIFDKDNKLVVLIDHPMGELENIGDKQCFSG